MHVPRDPVKDVVENSLETDRGVEGNRATFSPEPLQGITMGELQSKWKDVVAELSTKGLNVTNADHALEGALSIR